MKENRGFNFGEKTKDGRDKALAATPINGLKKE